MKPYQILFLDIDNTLLDWDICVEEGLRAGFKKFGLGDFGEKESATFHRINRACWERLEKKEITFEELKATRFNLVFADLGLSCDGVAFETSFREFINHFAEPVAGAKEFLSRLAPHYVLATASNGPEAQQRKRLRIAGMENYFSYVFVSESLGASKPSKEFFDRAFSQLKEPVDPKCCLMIGDSLTSDIQGGKNAGMDTCFFAKHHEVISASLVQPDFRFDSLASIAEWLLEE